MATNRVQELAQVLRRLADSEVPGEVKKEAEDLVRSITPLELSLAELEREGLIRIERHRIVIVDRSGLEAKAML